MQNYGTWEEDVVLACEIKRLNKQQYDKMTQVQEKHTRFNKCGKKGHWE